MNPDDDIRRLLAEDDAEPDRAVDERIRLAAREAIAAGAKATPTAVRQPRRAWFYPASGIGAAAVVVLAVLVVVRAPDEPSGWPDSTSGWPVDAAEQRKPETRGGDVPATAAGYSIEESVVESAADAADAVGAQRALRSN